MSGMRTCACGCGRSLEGRRDNTRYVDSRHKQRAYRKRLDAEARAKGLSANLSLRTVRASRATQRRNGDARRRARDPDLRISYRKAVEAMAAELIRKGYDHTASILCAQMVFHGLLTERQRAAVEEREART